MPSAYNEDVLTEMIQHGLARHGRGAQTRLAEHLGVTVQTVNKWSKGDTRPEPERWQAIEEFFGMERGLIAATVMPRDRDPFEELTSMVLDLTERVARLESQVGPPRS